MDLFNDKEMELLNIAGVNIENKVEYTDNEKRYIFRQVTEFIMNHSSKNGDIGRLQGEYECVINKINVV
ncbi:MAG: hypothetical protein J6K42_00700 [Clostridia bacterium]|nr:hypothetical protein [Clostridia bacterium]